MAVLKIALSATFAFLLLEGLVFHTSFYTNYLEPSSSTGLFESTLRNEQKRKPFGPDEILVMGDSRIGEGFSAKIANAACSEHGYYYANASVPGAAPRCWYYLLRDLDPSRKRYRAIILPLDAYGDIDAFEDLSDRMLDLHYCIARLRYTDALEFASSFRTFRQRIEVFRGTIFKGIVFQTDLLAFFEHWHARLSNVATSRDSLWQFQYDYVGHKEDLAGIQVDWASKTIHFPDTIAPEIRRRIQEGLFGPVAKQEGAVAAYRRLWFGRILDLYRNSNTRFIFLALPRGPVVPPTPRIHPLSYSINDISRRPRVTLFPDNAFTSLENGEFYFDTMHLNARGRAQFSAILVHLTEQTLGPSRN